MRRAYGFRHRRVGLLWSPRAWFLLPSTDPRLQLPDHVGNGAAFGASRERQRHAMLENRLGQIEHVVDRGSEATVEQRTGANREHQRLAGARTRSPGDQLAGLAGLLSRARGAYQRENRLDDGV